MAYNRLIPQSTDLLSNSQSQILGNFQTIDAGTSLTGVGFSRNHVTMTDATNGGLHSRVDYYQNVADPVISGFVASLYPKSIAQGGLAAASQLFFNTATPYAITGAVSATSNGFAYLPGGILIKWGKTGTINSTGTFSFPSGATIPVFSNIFGVSVSPTNAGGSPDYFCYVGAPTTTGFPYDSVKRTTNTAASGNYFYIAIGN